jgi:Uma2 family endonuclease
MTTALKFPTTVVVAPPPGRYGTCHLPVRRFTVDEYHRMIEWGFFAEDDHFELLEGFIVAKMPRNPLHDATVIVAQKAIDAVLPQGWHSRPQCAITLSDSEPEPDLTVVRGRPRDYASHHPSPDRIALVIEVANTSLAEDRDWKVRTYARAGIPVYWIINLIDMRLEVYTDPTGPTSSPSYRIHQDIGIGQPVPLVLDGTPCGPLAVRDLIA